MNQWIRSERNGGKKWNDIFYVYVDKNEISDVSIL